jgi:gliding motility-associated-like protein
MLAYYYQLKIKPNKLAGVGFLRLKKHQLSTMRKQVLQFYLLLLLSLVGLRSAQAQSVSLALSSPTVCLGDQLSLDAALTGLPAGVTATNCTFDFNNDGTVDRTIPNSGPNYSTQHLYTTPGTYTIRAVVNLSNGSSVPATASIIVYRLPIPGAIVNGQAIQCFRGNLVTLTNSSVKTDNRIYRTEIIWGDGNVDVFPFPTPGQNYSHSFNANGQFNITVKVVDSVGCFKDTTYSGMLTIKPNLSPSFDVIGPPGCFCTPFMLRNTTTQVPFSQVRRYTWDFGDGKTVTRSRPWSLPQDEYNYDTIWNDYCKNGTFLPALIIEDITGCIDSLRYTNAMTANKPRNIVIDLNPIPYLSLPDTANGLRRDSVCFDKEGLKTLVFVQKPNPEINPGNGELLWNFGDPPSNDQNLNTNSWNPPHTFMRGLGSYNVNLLVWPLQPNPKCRKDTTIVIEVLGPRARIEDPQNQITLDPLQQNQCNPNASGYYNVINFVNTSQYYKSEHIFRRWDFGDDVAPQCTSFLIPRAGFPPPGGWATAQDQYNFSDGYWRQGGKIYEGKRLDCRYSADTLPMHRYTGWDLIYKWYRYGHDFMPWNTNQYTRTPADTLPTANPRKIWVTDDDAQWWNKPVYMDPTTGNWSLTQGSGPAPYGLWPRIDTVRSFDENGQPNPQDLRPYNRITLRNGAPDPLAGFWGNTKRGGYGFFPRGFIVDPLNDTMTAKYTSINGEFFRHHYDSMVDPTRTLYRYLFDKAVQRCYQVELFLKDSQNNVGNKTHIVVNDFTKLDSLDCNDDDQVQLKLMRPDATGLGVRGKECPGSYVQNNEAGLRFMLGSVDDLLGQYPGISPDCGASWIRINLDSMADRRDQTPCALDGFINYTGATGPSPQAGGQISTTPGGLIYPPFSLQPDYNQYFQPPNRWNAPGGTNFWYHYGSNVNPMQVTQSGITLFPPANPTGDITIGFIVGSGDPNNPCISDTVWYHNFLNITDMDGRFYLDPTYDPITGVPSNGECKYYCTNSTVNFVYLDSVQSFIRSSTISWGDNTVTVDSFYYSAKPGLTDGFYVNGFRRERYLIDFGTCGEDVLGTVLGVIPFPNGLPGANVTKRYIDNYTMRIYNAATNPNGSLIFVGRVVTNDSTIWQECGKSFTVADIDTIKTFYRVEELDPAKMLLPVKHTYWRSSYTADCKRPGSVPRSIRHKLVSTKDCVAEYTDNKLLVRGVIDSVMSRDAKGNFDNVFCKNEPVHFYDSVRYYRPDCSLSHPIFNPNGTPIKNPNDCKVSIGGAYDSPFNEYHYDTVNYWRNGSLDPNDFYPCGDWIEKVKYYFGDGDSASVTNPVHQYKQAGAYTVTMLSRDKNGCWDTAYCTVYVTEPNAIPVIKPGVYNCGNPVTFFDRSNMTPIPGFPNNPFDSIRFEPSVGTGVLVNRNYWYFGERKTDTLRFDAQYIDTPVWNYRGNGAFKIRLVVESAQGCKDTNWVDLNILGPRPGFKVITDTVGCAPFNVKVVNLADVAGATGPNDKPTKRTDILWGDVNQQSSISLNQYDTLSFTYNDSGTFYIFARSDDNNPQSDNIGCKIVLFPDTVGGINAPVKIQVKRSYPAAIEIDKQVVCVDQPFTVTNKSDTISYTEFKYEMYNENGQVLVDSVIKNNLDNKFTYTFADTGNYSVRLFPTKVAPGLPECKLFDTLPIRVVRPFASFTIDSAAKSPKFGFRNTSVSSIEYTWTASKNGNIIRQVDKVESDRDWSFDFGTDTGDVTICLQAFTPDPAKPVCMDSVCHTISYRFIIELEIYNVFTPSPKDGSNDFFDIKIQGEKLYDLVIYNRWGTKVFESTEAKYDWDGTNMNDGSDCPEGTYFYVFKYELLNGEKKTVNGTVTLIRE